LLGKNSENFTRQSKIDGPLAFSGKGSIGVELLAKCKLKAADEIKLRYFVTEQQKQLYHEQMTIEVPPRTKIRLIIRWMQLWQTGEVEIQLPLANTLWVPYRVAKYVTCDYTMEEVKSEVRPKGGDPEELQAHNDAASTGSPSAAVMTEHMVPSRVGEAKGKRAEGISRKAKSIKLFYSYSHKDEPLRDELEEALALLKREDRVSGWHDRRIGAGEDWKGWIDVHLESADIILLLVSASFIASDYCWDVEVRRALDRQDRGEAQVLPVILRPCDWNGAPFGKLQALPKDARAITTWTNRDEAWTDVAKGVRRTIERIIA
jgi:TIR domain